jgi:hypothetical protein
LALRRRITREGTQIAKNSQVAYAQSRLNDARRSLHDAVDSFGIHDETLIEPCTDAQRSLDEWKELDRNAAKGGLFSFLKF